MLESIRGTLNLLDPRSRRILGLLVLVQVALAFLDMLGVLLFGAVAALSAAAVSGEEPAFLGDLLDQLNFDQGDEIRVAVLLAAVAGLVLVSKSVLSFLMIRSAFRFLANRQAMVSSRLASRLLSRPLLDVQRRVARSARMRLFREQMQQQLGCWEAQWSSLRRWLSFSCFSPVY